MKSELVALWHFTPLSNLDSILRESRLLSYATMQSIGLQPDCVSDKMSRAQDLANGRAKFVFLSLAHYSTFYQKSTFGLPHVWFRISPDILMVQGVKTKSSASQSKHNQPNAVNPKLLQMCMTIVNADTRIRYRADGGPEHCLFRINSKIDSLTSSALSTEILVPDFVDLCKYAEGIYIVCSGEVKVLLHPLRNNGSGRHQQGNTNEAITRNA
jgi:hypothetical protein